MSNRRLGAGLRKLKSQYGSKKLADGKPIGGYGRLTGERIEKLQTYYGLAIHRHKDNVNEMREEIWAGLYHTASSDENPQHQFCPKGPESWCKFHQAALKGEVHHHSKPLPEAVVDILKPLYHQLSKDSILEGCLGGFTQNNCESLNHLISARCPKSMYSGRSHLDAATAAAVITFNDGKKALCYVLDHLGIEVGLNTLNFFLKTDLRRVRGSNNEASEVQKKIRKGREMRRKASEDKDIHKEGVTYTPGGF